MQSSPRESIQTVCWPTGPSLDGGGGIIDLRDWDGGELRSYLRQLALGLRSRACSPLADAVVGDHAGDLDAGPLTIVALSVPSST
jgi:hypothetical protein